MAKSTVVLIVLGVILVVGAVAFIAFCNIVYGSIDGFVEMVMRASLQARYDRLVAGQATWPWAVWIFLFGFVAVLILVLLVVLYLTLMERKLLGWFQIRLGPNRVGPWGLLQPFADMVKLLIKEDIVPRAADKALHLIAPLFIFIPTLLAFVAIPFAAGTVELPQELVSPTFDSVWVEWVPSELAGERGLPGPGFLEAEYEIEDSEEYHKTWWVSTELDHEPLFIPTDADGYDPDNRYRNPYPLTLPIKQENPGAPVEYLTFYSLVDFETAARAYDVLEIRWEGSRGHMGVVEIGIDGEKIDQVEDEFSEIIAQSGPEIPYEERFQFSRPPKRYIENLFSEFTNAVAINNRSFGVDSMSPAFGRASGAQSSWRDIYTMDWKHTCYIHGWVDGDEEKASLFFFPSRSAGEEQVAPEADLEGMEWQDTEAAFRLQRMAGSGYLIETPDGNVTNLTRFGDTFDGTIGGEQVTLTLKSSQYYTIYIIAKDLGIGIIYILAVTSLAVLGIFMAGFGANNKWSLFGAVRSAAQLISYEVPMTLAVLGPVLMSGTLSVVELVESQRSVWFVLPQFLAFYVFLTTMTAEVNRSPFDLPEAESELVAGYHTEYTGLKFGFFFLAEYANMFLSAAVMSILFFGGWKGPFDFPFLGEFASSFIWFMAKCLFWMAVFIWFRATFPRFRIDQMMDYAWKVLLPIAMVNIVLTGYFAYSDWHFVIWKENNWRIWESYIKPLFVNEYTKIYAVPFIVIITILIVTDVIGRRNDLLREKALKETAGPGA